jgi:nucleoside 2-deoxyribosyltransferase
MKSAYLAGPDVFLPDASDHAERKVAICARHGILGCPPLNEDIARLKALPDAAAWLAIFRKDIAMMEASDSIIANLTPFRGASADAGTLIELGWFFARGKPVFGYSNSSTPFAARSERQIAALPDPLPGLTVGGFGLADNLMIAGAVLEGGLYPLIVPPDGRERGFDDLEMFERCVEIAAWKLKLRPPPDWAQPPAGT